MLLLPKKTKFNKWKKNYLRNSLETKSFNLQFGVVGLKALQATRLTVPQLESTRQYLNRTLMRKGKVWIPIFPQIPITQKPTATRMGKGKGNVSHWVVLIKAGTVLFEVNGVPLPLAVKALERCKVKLPILTKIVIL